MWRYLRLILIFLDDSSETNDSNGTFHPDTLTCWKLPFTFDWQLFLFVISWRSIGWPFEGGCSLAPPAGHAAMHLLTFPPSLSHNAEMGRLSLTGTHMTTGTLDDAQHLVWHAVHAAGWVVHWRCFFSAASQRGHVQVHSMFSIPTADDYLLPTVKAHTHVPLWAGLFPNGQLEPATGSM